MKTRLTTSDISNKQFKPSSKGYDALEVDKFLDLIIEDYEYYENTVRELKISNKTLFNKLTLLESDPNANLPDNNLLEEIALLKKRISTLENTLSNLGLDPNKIK